MTQAYPLSPIQAHLHAVAAAADCRVMLEITGAGDDAILAVLDVVASHHEILRTRFPITPEVGTPVQQVGSRPAWSMTLDRGRLELTIPGLAMDRRSVALLAKEIAQRLAGEDPEPGPQYPDIAVWLEDLATSPDQEAGRAFWRREELFDADAVLSLPPSPGPVQVALPLGLAALAGARGVGLEHLLLAAWHLLLQRLTGRPGSRVGVLSDGRRQDELARALGPLSRLLPGSFATDLSAPIWNGLERLAAATEARHGQAEFCPFPPTGRMPGFCFAVEMPVRVTAGPVGIVMHGCTTLHEPNALRLSWDGAGIVRVDSPEGAGALAAYAALLADLVASPDKAAGELALMSDATRSWLLDAFNDTATAEPVPDIIALFEQACDQAPDAVAIRHGGGSLDYRTLDARANAVAMRLRALGIGAESRVGLLAARSPGLVAGLLGILKAGAAFVPLARNDPHDRLDWIARDAGLSALVCAPDVEALPGLSALPLVILDDDEAPRAVQPIHPAQLAYVLYTSGSTGRPKGVMVPHGGLANYLDWALGAYPASASGAGGVPVHTSIAFDLTLTALLLPLLRGESVVLLDETRPMAALVDGLAEAAEWSLLKLTPSHLRALAGNRVAGGTQRLVVGGEMLLGAHLAAWAADDPDVVVVNEYGPTETVVGCCVHVARAGDLPPGPVPIGAPIANASLYVLDARGQPVPPGVEGELFIGGAGVARGYVGRPDLTAERFLPDPFGKLGGARLYRSGDLARHRFDRLADGRLADNGGSLDYLGRADEQMKLNGHRIEPAEVEAAMLRHPAVAQAAVAADGSRLLGFAVLRAPVAAVALVEALAGELPAWMVPVRIRLLASLPLAASGKLDRRALLTLPDEALPPEPPRDDTERLLAGIWSKLLDRPVGVQDDFFRLGGDSILGLQLVARARRAGLALPPDAVFTLPTIALQAAFATAANAKLSARPASTLPAQSEGDWFGLHPVQAGFLDSDPFDAAHEVQSLLLRPPVPLDMTKLRAALDRVQSRHGMLRARFARDGSGDWRQRIDPDAAPPPLALHDLRTTAEPAHLSAETAIARYGEKLKRSLDLADGPIWGATLFECDDGQALLLVAHHLVVDRVSWSPLLEDLRRALDGELEPPSLSYPEWLAALVGVADSPVAREAAGYWENAGWSGGGLHLDDPTASTEERFSRQLDRQLPCATNRTQLLAALRAVISAHQQRAASTGPFDVVIDVEHHGRDGRELGIDLDTSETIGWFTAIAPLHLPDHAAGQATAGTMGDLPAHGLPYIFRRTASPPGGALLFNHLGSIGTAGLGGDFILLSLPTGPDRSPQRRRSHPLTLTTVITGDVLHCSWVYTAQLTQETVSGLAEALGRHLIDTSLPCIIRAAMAPGAAEAIESRQGPLAAILPTTSTQQAMLFQGLRDPGGGAYIDQTAILMRGVLDPDALHRGWTAVAQRQPALRTMFGVGADGLPVQLVLRDHSLSWTDEDWREDERAAPGAADAALARLLAEDRALGFDGEAAPPLRFRMVRLGEEAWWLLWTRHHALMDGWSLSPLLMEMQALAAGTRLPPLASPAAFTDWLATRDRTADRQFWKRHLGPFKAPTPLGGRSIDGPVRATAERRVSLSGSAFQDTARRSGITPATLLAGAWGLLLALDAGEDHAVFGMTTSGRDAEFEGAMTFVGLLIATLPVIVRIVPEQAADAWLRDLQKALAAARRHEHCSPDEQLRAAGLAPGTILFRSLLVFENYPVDPALLHPAAGALQIVSVKTIEQTDFPLALLAGFEEQDLSVCLRYDSRCFREDDIASRLGRLQALLLGLGTGAMLSDVMAAMAPVGVTRPSRAATRTWEDGPALPHPADATLQSLIRAQARRTPHAAAVIAGDDSLSYSDLLAQAEAVASRLAAAGIGRGDVVGIGIPRGMMLLPALLGILLRGSAYCPLEADQPSGRLEAMVADAGIRIMLCLPGTPAVSGCTMLPLRFDEIRTLPGCDEMPCGALDTAYVLFTSGSTGRPKGVCVPQQAIVNRLLWMQRMLDIGPADRILQKTPLGFDVSVWELFLPLLAGASLVMAPPEAHRDPEAIRMLMHRHAVTVIHFVPSMLRAFLAAPGIEAGGMVLRHCIASGETLGPELATSWRSRFAAPLHNFYGPTEAAIDVTAWQCGAGDEATTVPIGRPVDNTRTRILDAAMRPVAQDIVGGLWISGVQLARGYANAPGLTADAFRPDPDGVPGGRMYDTGDHASWRADGALLYHGRADTQIKLRGMRVEIGEIEAVLRTHPRIAEAAVAYDGTRLLAWLAPGIPGELDVWLDARLPKAMQPGRCFGRTRLPLTASGKIDRGSLLADRMDIETELPRNALELRIGAIATELLGHAIGPRDGLFAAGLHSLTSLQMVNRIRMELGFSLSLPMVFETGTVAGIAAALTSGAPGATAASPLVRLRQGIGMPIVLVHPVGGDVACFLRLAALIERPVWALQSAGLFDDASPGLTVEGMAESYVHAVRSAIREPVLLAGYSMGCAIAFEMAQRLDRQLHRLVLIDGSACPAPCELGIGESALHDAIRAGALPDGVSARDAERQFAVATLNQRALGAWRPAPAPLSALLFRSSGSQGLMGWDHVLTEPPVTIDLPWKHEALVQQPAVAELARILEQATRQNDHLDAVVRIEKSYVHDAAD